MPQPELPPTLSKSGKFLLFYHKVDNNQQSNNSRPLLVDWTLFQVVRTERLLIVLKHTLVRHQAETSSLFYHERVPVVVTPAFLTT